MLKPCTTRIFCHFSLSSRAQRAFFANLSASPLSQENAEAREEVEQMENAANSNQARYERLSEYSLDPANQARYAAKEEEWAERAEAVAQYRSGTSNNEAIPAPERMRMDVNAEMKANGFNAFFGGNEAETALEIAGAEAMVLVEYDEAGNVVGGNVYFAERPTISALQEELFHVHQAIRGDYNDAVLGIEETFLRREIDANKHLLKIAQDIEIPGEELKKTESMLKLYERRLRELTGGAK